MAAVKSFNVERISSANGLLIDTLQIVAPRTEIPVPNHILDTKIYSKVAQNAVVQANPSVIHFGGFKPGETFTQELRLANVSTEVQRYHIIPPQTKYFKVHYTKKERLVPGLSIDCIIEFNPDEWRYYYDCIRIHSKASENLIIPIHAYPVMQTTNFPSHVDFPAIPVGHIMSKTIPLSCGAPIDFEYQLAILQHHPAFKIEPLSGLVPANGETELTITFSPSEFSTAIMRFKLLISQFNCKPISCTVVGHSSPGLLKSRVEASFEPTDSVLDPRVLSPIDRSRSRRKIRQSMEMLQKTEVTEIEREGLKFPVNIDCPYAVASVLNQQPGKLRAKDLREVVAARKENKEPSNRQMKEALFEHLVRQNVYEERQNQLRWQVKVGDEPVAPAERLNILKSREEAWEEYKLQRGDPVFDDEVNRQKTKGFFRRSIREYTNVPEKIAKFDLYTNDLWESRHRALGRFAQAAYKVIVRYRADIRVAKLREIVDEWKKNRHQLGTPSKLVQQKRDNVSDAPSDMLLIAEKVKSITFPTYVPPDVKDDMAPDALDDVSVNGTSVGIKKKVTYFSLKVPQLFKLMDYGRMDVHQSARGYVPPKFAKPLRTGAEDEVINLPVSKIENAVVEPDLKVEDYTTPTPRPAAGLSTELKPPESLFEPVEYPPLHIFNPTPGLQTFMAPLPYAETDPDFHLCPIPQYISTDTDNPHTTTQKKYLDREDCIRGIMTWKKFPSQGLMSLSNTPTLTNVWMPRWTDPFGHEVLPHQVPPLFEGLAEDDRDNIIEDAEEEGVESPATLTPEMVNAQFSLISTHTPIEDKPKDDMFPFGNKMPTTNIPVSSNGPVPRERREEELDFFLNKKYNRLGQKIQHRTNHINDVTTNQDLVLK